MAARDILEDLERSKPSRELTLKLNELTKKPTIFQGKIKKEEEKAVFDSIETTSEEYYPKKPLTPLFWGKKIKSRSNYNMNVLLFG